MKQYAVTIKTCSAFGTPLKGDTLFGQFCWELFSDPDLVEQDPVELLKNYHDSPFIIFSSAFPRIAVNDGQLACALKRPDYPFRRDSDNQVDKRHKYLMVKEEKKKKWFIHRWTSEPLRLEKLEFITDEELMRSIKQSTDVGYFALSEEPRKFENSVVQAHNTINRLSNTTGLPPYAPFNLETCYYGSGKTELVLFILFDEKVIDIEKIVLTLNRIGLFGYGRDASTGMGKFKVSETVELPLFEGVKFCGCYTLAPCVPEKGKYTRYSFSPFTRFGKHGNIYARASNPFKNPVIMADEGAVLMTREHSIIDKPYVGQAIGGVSKIEPNAVVQGYAPYIPVETEN